MSGRLFFLFLILSAFPLACGSADPCENSPSMDFASPDGELTAWVFLRACGATVADSVQVSIQRADEEKPRGSGNTFIVQPNSTVLVKWSGPRSLEVSYSDGGEIFLQETQVAGASITYRTQSPSTLDEATRSDVE